MLRIKYKFLFVYNVVFNSIGFCLIFPSDMAGKSLYMEDLNPPDLPVLVAVADARLEKYNQVCLAIKDSSRWEREWVFAEYELEEARVNRAVRTLG